MRYLALCLLCITAPVCAAPLDGLLTALPETYADKLTVEVGYDMANDTVDVFNFRGGVSQDVGDYAGGHVRIVWPVTRFLQIDGALWKRGIDYHQDTINLDSWQVGAQHRVANQQGPLPALALRLGAWGSRADTVMKSSDTVFTSPSFGLTTGQTITLGSVTVSRPEDQQSQLDLIASWEIAPTVQMDLFAGLGKGKTKIGGVTANNISYNGIALCGAASFEFTRDGRAICTATGQDFSALAQGLGFGTGSLNVYPEAEYKFTYAQAGLALSWHQDNWHLRGSYLFQKFNRDHVDALIVSRNGRSYTTVQTLSGEVAYRLGKGVAAFLRGQIMDHNLMGETPLAYNTLTASRFSQRYGLLTLGLVVGL